MRNTLRPPPFRPGIGLPVSVGLHGLGLAALLAANFVAPSSGPIINPDDVLMEVSMMALPKQTTALPQKASRAPDPVVGAPDPEPTPEKAVTTDSDLVEHRTDAPDKETTDAPKKDKGEDDKRRKDKDKALRDAARKAALEGLEDAPLGTEDRRRTDPDGVEGATGSSRGMGDPKVAAYAEKVRRAVEPNFNPIQTDSGLVTIVQVRISATGALSDPKVHTKSGDASFDAAALRAVIKTAKVPAPPADIMDGKSSVTVGIKLDNSG